MTYGLQRYYKVWNSKPGPNYFILDRNTGEKMAERQMADLAENLVKELNDKDRKERGLDPILEIEISSRYTNRTDKTPIEIAPMVKHS
jgi:hypothetical protein